MSSTVTLRAWMQGRVENSQIVGRCGSPNVPIEKCLDCIKEHFDCTICRDPLYKPIQTQCGHVFCGQCLKDLCSKPGAKCPLCKTAISNRALITREDIGDVVGIVGKLKNVFATELERFFDMKEKKERKRRSRSGTPVVAGQLFLRVADSTSKENRGPGGEDKEGSKDSNRAVVSISPKRTADRNRSISKPSRNDDMECVELDKDDDLMDIEDLISPVSNKKTVVKSKSQPEDKNELLPSLSASKSASKSEVAEKLLKQTYCIMSTDVVCQPLDLSLSRKKTPTELKYVASPVGVRFVKPLDLSMKSEKRKLDEMEETNNKGDAGYTPSKQGAVTPKRKRGKFGDDSVSEKNEVEAKKAPTTPAKLKAASKSKPVTKAKTPSKRKNKIVEESPIPEDQIVFTPTPPPVKDKVTPKKALKYSDRDKIVSKKPTVSTQFRSAGITQNFLAQEIMKDFDDICEEEEEEERPPLAPPSNYLGRQTTNSDEMLTKIMDASLNPPKSKTPKKLQQARPQKPVIDLEDDDDDDAAPFIFKPPIASTPQVPKLKARDLQKKKQDDILMEVDEDFQEPRDSDLLFLNLSMGGANDKKVEAQQNPTPKTSKLSREKRRHSSTDNEKENGSIRPRSLSRNRSGSRNASPVKSSKLAKFEEDDSRKIAESDKVSDQQNIFQEEDDQDDWLLDIPENSGKQKAGKAKDKSLIQDIESPPPKQPYVFCPTRLNKAQTAKLHQLCKMCNGTITKEFKPEVTHLVINLTNGRVPQTLKYLLAIAGRKWVVIYDWIEECVSKGELVSEAPYETSNFKQCDPGVRRSRLSKKNLFEGFKFYFATEIYITLGFSRQEVNMLLNTLGASVVDSADDQYTDLIIIGICNGNTIEYNDWLNTNKWVTVTFDWVIECILEYRLKPFEPKHLCIDTSKVTSINAPKPFQAAFSQYMSQRAQSMSPF